LHNSMDSDLFVFKTLEVALHQSTPFLVVLTAKNRRTLINQLSEAQVDPDPVLALALGRNGRLELDRALVLDLVSASVGKQLVQLMRELSVSSKEINLKKELNLH
jgi:hypothetical protein